MFKNEADTEWGSKKQVPAAQAPGTNGQGQPVTLAKLEGPTTTTQMVCVAMHALPVIDPNLPSRPFAGGPLVGIVEWSGGGGGGQIEFDVPSNCAGGTFAGGILPGVSPGGGAMVSVPASAIKAYVRNDANVTCETPAAGVQPLGNPTLDPIVSAFVGYGPKTGRLTRTIFVVKQSPGSGLNAPRSWNINVPPYARSFVLFRVQTVAADVIQVRQVGPNPVGFNLETFAIPGTIQSPVFQTGPANFITLLWPAANAGLIESLCVVFDIEN